MYLEKLSESSNRMAKNEKRFFVVVDDNFIAGWIVGCELIAEIPLRTLSPNTIGWVGCIGI